MTSTGWAVTIIIILLVLGGGWWYASQPGGVDFPNLQEQANQQPAPSANGSSGVDVGVDVGVSTAPMSASVTYGANGFSPAEVTIKKGGTVTWTNNSGGNMWVGSAQHPTHMVYSGTSLAAHCDDEIDVSFDQCENGSSYSFTFARVGTWAYHNHSSASHFGRVIVVE